MLDLYPRFLIRQFPNLNQRYFAYVFTSLGIGITAVFYLSFIWQHSQVLSTGYSFIGSIKQLIHFGLRCPLCGGTRSFVSMFSGNFVTALHYNLFGTVFFVATYLLLPFRIALTLNFENAILEKVQRFDSWLEKNILYLIAVAFIIQITLDYFGTFAWFA